MAIKHKFYPTDGGIFSVKNINNCQIWQWLYTCVSKLMCRWSTKLRRISIQWNEIMVSSQAFFFWGGGPTKWAQSVKSVLFGLHKAPNCLTSVGSKKLFEVQICERSENSFLRGSQKISLWTLLWTWHAWLHYKSIHYALTHIRQRPCQTLLHLHSYSKPSCITGRLPWPHQKPRDSFSVKHYRVPLSHHAGRPAIDVISLCRITVCRYLITLAGHRCDFSPLSLCTSNAHTPRLLMLHRELQY